MTEHFRCPRCGRPMATCSPSGQGIAACDHCSIYFEATPPERSPTRSHADIVRAVWSGDRSTAIAREITTLLHGRSGCGHYVVTDRRIVGWADRERTLHIGRSPVVTVLYRDRFCPTDAHIVRVYSVQEGRKARDDERLKNRYKAEAYEARRREAGVLLQQGRSLEYWPGQRGGVVCLPTGEHVGAYGALRAAGIEPKEIWEILQGCQESLEVSPRVLARVRRELGAEVTS